ncbi:MAG: hypothetical protein JWO42_3878 [Chloroflexi bacterium]|jgi:hypothetical protein|nr:hypothetical protein [Chloroflexota bacterium]
MPPRDESIEPRLGSEAQDPAALDDTALEGAIQAQRQSLAAIERAFIQARERFDRERRHLRAMEQEQERRQLLAAGQTPEPEPERKARKKRSTTGMDALLGRDGIEPDLPFDRFILRSLQRQEIILNPAGARSAQTIALVAQESGDLIEAHTFGEARAQLEQGHTLGRPGVPLQRQAIWNVEQGKSGWLRLDQIFVERRGEGE